MSDERERWAVILGASSGMGEATGRALAAAGYRIFGIHLDFRAGWPTSRRSRLRSRGRLRGPLHQHERGRRREAGGGAGHPARALRSVGGRRAPPVRPGRDAFARLRLARPVHRGRPEGGRRPKEDGDDPGRHGQQPRLLGPGPVSRRLPRAGLEDLLDDLGGVDRASSRHTGSCRRPRPPSSRTPGSWRWSWLGPARASPRTPSARA